MDGLGKAPGSQSLGETMSDKKIDDQDIFEKISMDQQKSPPLLNASGCKGTHCTLNREVRMADQQCSPSFEQYRVE